MVSIVIPCYNVETYVANTIDSILKQTDEDWEIIAIDDGSSDNTFDVLSSYSQKDSRIRVKRVKNQGVSAARNIGITFAYGDWIYFLDGDDVIEDGLVAELNGRIDKTEMLLFDFVKEKRGKVLKKYKIRRLNDILGDFLVNSQTICMCSFAVKREFINNFNLKFDTDTYYGEDREFIAKILVNNPQIQYVNRILFRYQLRSSSAMGQKDYSMKRYSSILASERTYRFLRGHSSEKKAYLMLVFTIIRHFKMYCKSKNKDPHVYELLLEYIDKYVKGIRFYGFKRMGLYSTLAGIMAYNKIMMQQFVKIY
ncbi:MAG: glycosyltransferase [Muribaculaceae bacterium]|nr:glycosyltransferase [Muribaculaceae bacterium]